MSDLEAVARDGDQLAGLSKRAGGLHSAEGGRALLGITGKPGAGKSTLSQTLVERLGDSVGLVGMDGFHLSQERLDSLGRATRKGAIDTFDAAGFVSLVRRLREEDRDVVYAPEFRRDREESIAGAIAIGPEVELVIIEGNYLLVEVPPWRELGGLFDEVWYVDCDEETRVERLIARHMASGKSAAEAREFALGSDQRNARLVAATQSRADLVVRLEFER